MNGEMYGIIAYLGNRSEIIIEQDGNKVVLDRDQVPTLSKWLFELADCEAEGAEA